MYGYKYLRIIIQKECSLLKGSETRTRRSLKSSLSQLFAATRKDTWKSVYSLQFINDKHKSLVAVTYEVILKSVMNAGLAAS